MPQAFNLDTLSKQLTGFARSLQTVLKAPTFWPQFITILVVFVIARWLVSPLIHRFLDLMMKYAQRVARFRQLWIALNPDCCYGKYCQCPCVYLPRDEVALGLPPHLSFCWCDDKKLEIEV